MNKFAALKTFDLFNKLTLKSLLFDAAAKQRKNRALKTAICV
jgi:hypothetical protein